MKHLPTEHTTFARRHPKAYLWLHGGLGLLVAVLSGWAFVALADEFPEQAGLYRLDIGISRWMESHGTEAGEALFVWISRLGSQVLTAVLVGVAILLIVRRHWRHLAVLIVTTGGGALLNYGLKTLFHRARPPYAVEFRMTTWSFPSGHAMDSLIGYGLLGYWLGRQFPKHRTAIWSGAALLILMIGFARIFLSVHYFSDVVAGFAAGAVWLLVCITGFEFAERRRVGPNGSDEVPG